MDLKDRLRLAIRDVKDFPKQGIVFKDISPIMLDASLSRGIVQVLTDKYRDASLNGIAGVESRGFLFGYPLAIALGIPFILIRKQGKLPYKKISHAYELEYGSAIVEMHEDAIHPGDRILIHDDLLATGGSAAAAAELILKCNGIVAGFDFLVELSFLEGRSKLSSYSAPTETLIAF